MKLTASPLRVASALAAAALVAAPAAGRAQATTITFSSLACRIGAGNNTFNVISAPVDVQGFRFAYTDITSADTYRTPCSSDEVTYTGTTALYPRLFGVATLTQISGNPFSISSIDLAPLFYNNPAQTVTFIGTLVGGTTVSQTFNIPAQPVSPVTGPRLATYAFLPTFTDLVSLQFGRQGGTSFDLYSQYQFTNLQLNGGAVTPPTTTPEPSTWALLGAGLAGVAAVRRRRANA